MLTQNILWRISLLFMDANSISTASEIQSHIETIEGDTTLNEETNFESRTDVIDFIDFHIIDRIEGLQQKGQLKNKLHILKHRAEKVKCELEKIDINLFKRLREDIRANNYINSPFEKVIRKYLGSYFMNPFQPDSIGYDNLDVFINRLLTDQVVPDATKESEPEMVFYQKTPARIIFQMVKLAALRPDDVFFDLGSGLGQVVILMNLISGCTSKGIEYDPGYCNYAKACVSQLDLLNVEFINADVRKGDYSEGTIFFMYSPFEGSMLQDVLDILQKESWKRMIRIFTYGPCSFHVSRESWLYCANGKGDNLLELYEFRSLEAKKW